MSLEELYRQHANMVYNVALGHTGNVEDAEEITQDVFVKVHQKLDTFNEDAQVSTWIYRIVVNTSLDYLKAKKRKKRWAFMSSIFDKETETSMPKEFNHPGAQLESKEALSKIYMALDQLNERQKSVIILAKVEGKSQKEIGEIMEMSPKAVESLLQRAKKNLAEILKQNEGL